MKMMNRFCQLSRRCVMVCALLVACTHGALGGDMPFPATSPITTAGYIQTGVVPTTASAGGVRRQVQDETAKQDVNETNLPFTAATLNWLYAILLY
jgi:hypothetical protein